MAREKVIKKRVNEQEHALWELISKLSGKTFSDIIQQGFECEKTNVEYKLKTEKHYAICDIMTEIMLLKDDDGKYFILEAIDFGLKDSIESLRQTNNTNPIQTEANLPAIVAEFEMFLEQEIEGEKAYNLIGDKLAEWDQVKQDWKL